LLPPPPYAFADVYICHYRRHATPISPDTPPAMPFSLLPLAPLSPVDADFSPLTLTLITPPLPPLPFRHAHYAIRFADATTLSLIIASFRCHASYAADIFLMPR
jgi:hypothetical protein